MTLFVVMIYSALPYLFATEPSYRRAAGHTNWALYVALGAGFFLISLGLMASSAWRIFQLWRNPIASSHPHQSGNP
jgi:hypothetical protein